MPHSEELDNREVLAVHQLNIAFQEERQFIPAVQNLSFTLRRGETLAIVGESGSGKSVTALALMRLLEQTGGQISSEKMLLRRRNRQVIDLNELSGAQMQGVRGADIAMIFQEPMTSLNPVFPVGEQIAESIRLHQGLSGDEALREARRMLELVRIPEAQAILGRYPHQLSGGMRQRVMIAMALSCRPAVLIADEPTTALDVTIQAQILQLLKEMQVKYNLTIVLITHDLGVVANIADRVAVMYAGDIVEIGTSDEIYYDPRHPYTWALLSSMPQMGIKGEDLFNIQGTPPNLFTEIHGDAFAPRNPQALKIDFVKRPPYFTVSPTHKAKTWLLDPRAPKVEPPAAVKLLKEEGMQDA